jgi:hypothetical protein
MPWYTTETVEDIPILRLKGDASTRAFQWLGGVDGLLMRGRRQLVVSLEQVVIPGAGDTRFVASLTRRVEDVDGDVVFVAPNDTHAQTILRQAGVSRAYPFVTTVAAGISMVRPRGHSSSGSGGTR